MNVYSLKIFGCALIAGIVFSTQALRPALIAKEAQLVTLVNERAVAQLTQQLSEVAQQFPTEMKEVEAHLADYIRSIRNHKIAQLAQNNGRSQKIAAVKAALWGCVVAGCTINWLVSFEQFINLAKMKSEGNGFQEIVKKYMPNMSSHLKSAVNDHSMARTMVKISALLQSTYIFVPIPLYLAGSWTYENTQFARYGNSLLIQDICILDEMMNSVQSIA